MCTEHGVSDEFEAAYGHPFAVDTASAGGTPARAWLDDLLALFRALAVVTSNGPGTPGGGGAPLAPPPPPFCA